MVAEGLDRFFNVSAETWTALGPPKSSRADKTVSAMAPMFSIIVKSSVACSWGSIPLSKPFPVKLAKGEKVWQKVTFQAETELFSIVQKNEPPIEIAAAE